MHKHLFNETKCHKIIIIIIFRCCISGISKAAHPPIFPVQRPKVVLGGLDLHANAVVRQPVPDLRAIIPARDTPHASHSPGSHTPDNVPEQLQSLVHHKFLERQAGTRSFVLHWCCYGCWSLHLDMVWKRG